MALGLPASAGTVSNVVAVPPAPITALSAAWHSWAKFGLSDAGFTQTKCLTPCLTSCAPAIRPSSGYEYPAKPIAPAVRQLDRPVSYTTTGMPSDFACLIRGSYAEGTKSPMRMADGWREMASLNIVV